MRALRPYRSRCVAVTHAGRQCTKLAYPFSARGLCSTHLRAERQQLHVKVGRA